MSHKVVEMIIGLPYIELPIMKTWWVHGQPYAINLTSGMMLVMPSRHVIMIPLCQHVIAPACRDVKMSEYQLVNIPQRSIIK